MKKRDKIETVFGLLKPAENKLTAKEISFLKGRKGLDYELLMSNRQPLIINLSDSKPVIAKLKGIAARLKLPVIQFTKHVIKDKQPVTNHKPEPIKEVINEFHEVYEPEVIPDPEVMEPEPELELVESEPTIKPGVKYRLSFPNAWTIDMDDDDTNMVLGLK